MSNNLDIVLPCYRPPEGWTGRIISSMQELSRRLPDLSIRLILVNDGSPAGVEAGDIDVLHAHLPGMMYVDLKINQGKGAALRRGVGESTGRYCVFTDIDFPYTLDSVVSIVEELQSGTDIAIGIKDQSYYAHTPAIRKAISKVLRLLARTFLRIPITDTQCGLKGFNEAGRAIFLQTTIKRYLADLEFIFLADRSPLSMKAVTVALREGVEFSQVNVRILLTEGMNFMKVWGRSLLGKTSSSHSQPR
ncbi:MAG: glycosyltransferase [Bacteroidia bacterium]|nr:glycosyltransferase [Bacteroidia bacterium]